MPTEITQAIDTAQRLVAQVPGALIVIVLLGGPTAVWLVYTALKAVQRRRYQPSAGQPLWICVQCRSANELRVSRCYRCGLQVTDADALEIVGLDRVPPGDPRRVTGPDVVVVPGTRSPVPVMATRAELERAAALADAAAAAGVAGASSFGVADPARAAPGMDPDDAPLTNGVPVGPGRPIPTAPRRVVMAGTRPAPAHEAPADAEPAPAPERSERR